MHTHGGEGHGHPHDPIEKIEPQIPEPVLRLIALGETVGAAGVMVVEDSRLKGDELISKGLVKGLPYYEKRFMVMRGVLQDKRIITEDELSRKISEVRREEEKGGRSLGAFEIGVKALTRLLVGKGIVTTEAVDRRYEVVRARTPMTGAKIVARAWLDPAFKEKLKGDPKGAVMAWNASLLAPNSGEDPVDTWRVTYLEVLENTEKIRNVVVCTLCSCYPRGLLGEPPEWYTSDSYKERVVSDPKRLLEENGVQLDDKAEIRVYDSTADTRYMVLPKRPRGTEGMAEEELAKLVTRDSLIGAADPLSPGRSTAS